MSRSTPISNFRKHLDTLPVADSISGYVVRPFSGDADIADWINIRNRGFAEISPGRPWQRADFVREFVPRGDRLSDPNETIWFVEPSADGCDRRPPTPVGTVSCRIVQTANRIVATVNWLAVDPEYRRRRLARQLMLTVEAHCWRSDVRQVELSTLRTWTAAIQLYQSLGYNSLD